MEKEACMRSVEHAAELAGGPSTTVLLLVLDLIVFETRKLSSLAMAHPL
jgi:hypothetical protein